MLSRKTIKSIIPKPLINSNLIPKEFKTIMNEERKYRELKESIRMKKSQRSEKLIKNKN